MDEYPSNRQTKKAQPKKEEPKKLSKIVEGPVIRQKKPVGRKLKEFLLGVDPKALWMHTWYEIIIPRGLDGIEDAVIDIVQRRIRGDSGRDGGYRRSRSRNSYDAPGHFSYNKMSSNSRDNRRDETRSLGRRARMDHDFDEILLNSRYEADEVLNELEGQIHDFDSVSVAQLYNLVDIVPTFADEGWGWTDLSKASFSRVHGGKFLLNLPKPEPID